MIFTPICKLSSKADKSFCFELIDVYCRHVEVYCQVNKIKIPSVSLSNEIVSELRLLGIVEQDADIVMFLYRDDYYNEDSEKKNIAEVIMAKHRGGSTGTVELLWLGNYTKFANIDKYRE